MRGGRDAEATFIRCEIRGFVVIGERCVIEAAQVGSKVVVGDDCVLVSVRSQPLKMRVVSAVRFAGLVLHRARLRGDRGRIGSRARHRYCSFFRVWWCPRCVRMPNVPYVTGCRTARFIRELHEASADQLQEFARDAYAKACDEGVR